MKGFFDWMAFFFYFSFLFLSYSWASGRHAHGVHSHCGHLFRFVSGMFLDTDLPYPDS